MCEAPNMRETTGVKFVATKAVEQQDTLTLHRQREQLVKMRLMQTNTLREQVQRIKVIGVDSAKIEKRLGVQLSGDKNMQRVQVILGVGTLTAMAVIATMVEASIFKSGREFCAWLGHVPKQTGSGGKVRLGHISKRGDKSVRTLLTHGARAALCRAKEQEYQRGHQSASGQQCHEHWDYF